MSSSSSATSQNIYQSDNRRVLGENSISAENSTVTVNHTTLDGEVINRAFGSIGQAYDFSGQTIAEALGFGGAVLNSALNANADALNFADANSTRNSQMAYNVFSDALGSSDNALQRAFSFGANAMDRSFSTLTDSQNLVANAYAEAKGRGALTDKILIGAIGAMALVAFAAIKK